MSKPTALRELKQTRRLDAAAYFAFTHPDVRISSKVRRVLKRRMIKQKELMKP